jgi:hypothetical protein
MELYLRSSIHHGGKGSEGIVLCILNFDDGRIWLSASRSDYFGPEKHQAGWTLRADLDAKMLPPMPEIQTTIPR